MQISSKPEGAELFSDPLNTTYVLRKLFVMPSTQGGFRGVAFTDRESFYIAAAYALLITAIFGSLWQFVTYLALVFYPTEDARTIGQILLRNKDPIEERKRQDFENYYPSSGDKRDSKPASDQGKINTELLDVRRRKANRYIALVAIWNSSDPYSAMMLLVTHATVVFKFDKKAGLYDVIMIITAFVLVVGGIFAGVVVPANLELGNVAPANPRSVFFAMPAYGNDTQLSMAERVRAPAAQRAVGVVEYAKNQLRERVALSDGQVDSYSFKVTGVDFGLQLKDAQNFVLSSRGGCTFDNEAWDQEQSLANDSTVDHYRIFNRTYRLDILSAENVGGKIIMPSQNFDQGFQAYSNPSAANLTYAILPNTVGRFSYSQSTDPWYATVPTPPGDIADYGFPNYTIARGRPPLSCWQEDSWSYKGKTVNLLGLDTLGLNVPTVIMNELFRNRFIYPMTYDIGSALGPSILLMSVSSAGGVLDASAGSHYSDFERLILASYIATQDVLRDTTMSQFSPDLGLRNGAVDSAGRPAEGVGNFVISSTKVKALSLRVLISVPVVWIFLHLVLAITRCTRFTNRDRNSGAVSRFTLRATGLQAVQLYRMLDEEKCGDRDDWYGRLDHIPYIEEAKPVHKPGKSVERPRQSGTTPSQDGSDISVVNDGNTETVVPESRQPYLFLAPKVIHTATGGLKRNHLTFAGPVKYEHTAVEQGWAWEGKGPRSIATGPADVDVTVKQPSDDTATEISDLKEATSHARAMSPPN